MKRKISLILSIALILGNLELSFIDLTPVFAAVATDAYDTYNHLSNVDFSQVNNQVLSLENALSSSDKEQNSKPDYHHMTWGTDADLGDAKDNYWEETWQGNTGLLSSSPGHSFMQTAFNQLGVRATAQSKSGKWLQDSVYDATSSTPTTEDLFVTIGGSQYIVDTTYEIISRPYLRRYHFDAQAANYRYYKLGSSGAEYDSGGSYQQITWSHPGIILNETQNLYDVISNAGATDRVFRPTENAAYGIYARGARYGLTTTMSTPRTDQPYSGTIEYIGNIARDTHRSDDWYSARVSNYNTFSASATGNYSVAITEATAYKKEMWDLVHWLKGVWAEQDDNYRADEGEYNIDKPDSIHTLPDGWERHDALSFMYTYYSIATRKAGGNGKGGDFPWEVADSTGVAPSSYNANSCNRYQSNNVFDPVFVSYLYDWDGYGEAGTDAENGTLVANSDSDTYKPQLASVTGMSIEDLRRDVIKQDLYTHKHIDRFQTHELFTSRVDDPYLNLDYLHAYCNEAYFSGQINYGYHSIGAAIPEGHIIDCDWYSHIGTYEKLYDKLKDVWGVSVDESIVDYISDYYWAALDDVNSVYLPTGSGDDTFSFNFDNDTALLGGIARTADTVQYGMVEYNELAEVYYTQLYDLFLSCSGLFYKDELITLFHDGTNNFPGFDPSKLPADYDKRVATNLYLLFGDPIQTGNTYMDDLNPNWRGNQNVEYHGDYFDFKFALPFAVFPAGGDMDGAMEDDFDTYGNEYVHGNRPESDIWQANVYENANNLSMGEGFTQGLALNDAQYLMIWSPHFVKCCSYIASFEMQQSWDVARDARAYYVTDFHFPTHEGDVYWSGLTNAINDYNLRVRDGTIFPTSNLSNNARYFWQPNATRQEADHTQGSHRCEPNPTLNPECPARYPSVYHGDRWQPNTYYHIEDCTHYTGSCNCHEYKPGSEGDPITGEGAYPSSDEVDCGCHYSCATGHECSHRAETYKHRVECTGDETTESFAWDWGMLGYGTIHTDARNANGHNTVGARFYSIQGEGGVERITFKNNGHEYGYYNWDAESGNGATWTEQTKYMSFGDTIGQTFENVMYTNILTYSVWSLQKSEIRGLSRLIAAPVANGNGYPNDPIITEANTSLGYTAYDLNETSIDSNRGTNLPTGMVTGPTHIVWTALQKQGRVANSFNAESVGNKPATTIRYQGMGAGYRQQMLNVFATRLSDIPELHYYSSGYSNFVNGDPYAFHLMSETSGTYNTKRWGGPFSDDLYFKYNPYTQGGRSHSTFSGFVIQGLAHTLLTYDIDSSDLRKSDVDSDSPKKSYSNSIRIQGDYLSLHTYDDGSKWFNITGSYYDTWSECLDSEELANKFKLVNDDYVVDHPDYITYGIFNNELCRYLTAFTWTPGLLKYIQSRTDVTGEAEGAAHSDATIGKLSLDYINKMGDCFIIHTSCHGLNQDTMTVWDAIYIETGSIPLAREHTAAHDLGDINPYMCHTNGSPAPDSKGNDLAIYYTSNLNRLYSVRGSTSSYGESLAPSAQVNIMHSPTTNVPGWTYSGRSWKRYYMYDDPDVNKGVISSVVPLSYQYFDTAKTVKASDTSTWYDKNLAASWSNSEPYVNTHNALLTRINAQSPYVGYQTEGDGTHDISQYGGGDTQVGYDLRDAATSRFDLARTYVDNPGYGFAAFGVTPSSGTAYNGEFHTKAMAEVEVTHGNRATTADGSQANAWSEKYPWIQDVNLNRFLGNNPYWSGQVYNVYKRLIRSYESEAIRNANERTDKPTLRINANYTLQNTQRGNIASNEELPNSIVVYNPLSAQSAHLVKASTYLPDAINNGSQNSHSVDVASIGDIARGDDYLTGFDTIMVRDQRVGRRFGMALAGEEEFFTRTGSVRSSVRTSSTSHHYELRTSLDVATNITHYESLIETEAYTMSDYTITQNADEPIYLDASIDGNYHTFDEKQTLKVVTKDIRGNWYSFNVVVEEGDTIYTENEALFLKSGTDNFNLPYSSFQEAYYALEEAHGIEDHRNTNDYVPLEAGDTLIPMNASFAMGDGAVLELTLVVERDNNYHTPVADPFIIDVPANVQYYIEQTGTTYKVYFESDGPASLENVEFKATTDLRICWYSGSAVEASGVLLMSVGSGSGLDRETIVNDVSTINYKFRSTSYSAYTVERTGCYNSRVVDIVGTHEMYGVDIRFEAGLYTMQNINAAVNVSLDESDPHKVPNTNWRYYVLGWQTEEGHYISSIFDEALAYGSTVRLIQPIGLFDDSDVLTAETLDLWAEQGKLGVGRYNNNYYLIKLGDSGTYSTILDFYGLTVPFFDKISFGPETTLQPMAILSYQMTSDWRNYVHTKSYDYVFFCTGWTRTVTEVEEISKLSYTATYDVRYDVRAYDVRYSASLNHKIDIGLTDFEKDWIQVDDTIILTDETAYNRQIGSYLSLDDEYTLYWDNVADLAQVITNTESRSVTPALSRGWDAPDSGGDDAEGFATPKKSSNALLRAFWDTQNTGEGELVTDTTKWIIEKYVVFNVDMLGFTEGASFTLYNPTPTSGAIPFDPTTPAYKDDGTPNNIVYIPAGTRVYLGYYHAELSDEADNEGRFVDYGYNTDAVASGGSYTKDPNGDYYTYHFWTPLSDGESDNNVVVEYFVNGINYGEFFSSPQSTYVTSTEDFFGIDTTTPDEWGKPIYNVGSSAYIDNHHRLDTLILNTAEHLASADMTGSEYRRYNNVYFTDTLSIVGRVGGLTVVDSGDPRYQDSFKVAASDAPYAISPIIKRIRQYSNSSNPNTEGTQFHYVTDSTDVRGRLARTGEVDYTRTLDSGSLDPYANQWFMHFETYRHWLPVLSEVNIHADQNLPEQKLGYELYLSMQTIGNYYGSTKQRLSGDTESNLNGDFGQDKIQIRPIYFYIDESGDVTPLDVYYPRNGNYTLLNAGSIYDSASHADATDNGPYYLDAAYNAYYSMSVTTNTEVSWDAHTTYRLDQMLLRRLVTEEEAETTYRVIHEARQSSSSAHNQITTTILEPLNDDAFDLTYSYYYGNPQIMFLRENNRTFIGNYNDSINNDAETEWTERAKRYAQKWYFGLGLPSTAIFVKHGEHRFSESNIINGKNGYILVCIDVYAAGEKFILHYQSDLSDETLKIGPRTYSPNEWNVLRSKLPQLIPVSIYNTETLAPNTDLDTRGTF